MAQDLFWTLSNKERTKKEGKEKKISNKRKEKINKTTTTRQKKQHCTMDFLWQPFKRLKILFVSLSFSFFLLFCECFPEFLWYFMNNKWTPIQTSFTTNVVENSFARECYENCSENKLTEAFLSLFLSLAERLRYTIRSLNVNSMKVNYGLFFSTGEAKKSHLKISRKLFLYCENTIFAYVKLKYSLSDFKWIEF